MSGIQTLRSNMLKNKLVLEVRINERLYSLEISPESPLGEIYDALNQIRGFIIEKMVEEQKNSNTQKIEVSEVK